MSGTITGVTKASDLPTVSQLSDDRLLLIRGGKFYLFSPADLEIGIWQVADLNQSLGRLLSADETLQTNIYDEAMTARAAEATKASWPTGDASAALSGHRAVTINSAGLVAYAAPGDTVVGIIDSAYELGTTATIYNSGLLTESSWTWTAGNLIYLSASGVLTQTVPTTGILQVLGRAATTTSMLISIQPPISLV